MDCSHQAFLLLAAKKCRFWVLITKCEQLTAR